MSEFKSGVSDYASIRKTREDLFGPPPFGAENGIDVTPPEQPGAPATEPGHSFTIVMAKSYAAAFPPSASASLPQNRRLNARERRRISAWFSGEGSAW